MTIYQFGLLAMFICFMVVIMLFSYNKGYADGRQSMLDEESHSGGFKIYNPPSDEELDFVSSEELTDANSDHNLRFPGFRKSRYYHNRRFPGFRKSRT